MGYMAKTGGMGNSRNQALNATLTTLFHSRLYTNLGAEDPKKYVIYLHMEYLKIRQDNSLKNNPCIPFT